MKPENEEKEAARIEALAERLPLKQGLKHSALDHDALLIVARRKASIKTRIETTRQRFFYTVFPFLAERLPLKQGLKLAGGKEENNEPDARRKASIKTRIETQPDQRA